jgi:uncharacterized Tic20 family protein
MNRGIPDTRKERNPITRRRHKKEVLWQITVPVIVGGVFLLAISLLSITLSQIEASRWADISLIWLIIPAMVVLLISLVLLAASIFATIKIIEVIPNAAFQLHKVMIQLHAMVRNVSDRLAEPILRANSLSAALDALKRQIRRI